MTQVKQNYFQIDTTIYQFDQIFSKSKNIQISYFDSILITNICNRLFKCPRLESDIKSG